MISLKPRAFDLLLYFLQRPDQLIAKQELLDEFWRGVHVGDGVLKTHVGEIRQALGDSARSHQFIETVHRHGYRFVGQISSPSQARSEWPANDTASTDAAGSHAERDDTERDDTGRSHAEFSAAECLDDESAAISGARPALRVARHHGHLGNFLLKRRMGQRPMLAADKAGSRGVLPLRRPSR